MRDPHSPPPPPPPVKPAGTSVMLPLGIRCCGAAESFPHKEGGWRSACSHVGSGCTGALGPPWRPRLPQPRCKARGRPSSSAKCSILPGWKCWRRSRCSPGFKGKGKMRCVDPILGKCHLRICGGPTPAAVELLATGSHFYSLWYAGMVATSSQSELDWSL